MGHTFASKLLLLLPTSFAVFSFVLNSKNSSLYQPIFNFYKTLSFHEDSSSSLTSTLYLSLSSH
uniref:Uncharacterized protein n=1 Tax=Brassica campestris TaxID=3711 RepID=A0A3P5YTY3_BRACM|nr:unnamed protein product [Brassica rapa]